MNYKIGIDYGGTKIEGILINDKGEEILRKRSGYEKNYESGVDTIKNLVEEFDKHTNSKNSVGIISSLSGSDGTNPKFLHQPAVTMDDPEKMLAEAVANWSL